MKTIAALALSSVTLVACGTKTSTSKVADANDGSLPVVMTCSADNQTASRTLTISTDETGIVTDAQGKLVVAGHIAQFVEQVGYTCENDLMQPQFVGAPVYLWACRNALDSSDEFQIIEKNGVITTNSAANPMTCKAAQ